MSAIGQCGGCATGNHDQHRHTVVPAPEGGVGGIVCGCTGDCKPSNLDDLMPGLGEFLQPGCGADPEDTARVAREAAAMVAETPERKARSASYLSPHQMHRLDLACAPVRNAFPSHGPVLVGSVNERADFRDVDVRVILRDKDFDRMFGKDTADERGEAHGDPRWQIICAALSEWISDVSGLPVDFQIQRMTQANEAYSGGFRNPLGVRVMSR